MRLTISFNLKWLKQQPPPAPVTMATFPSNVNIFAKLIFYKIALNLNNSQKLDSWIFVIFLSF